MSSAFADFEQQFVMSMEEKPYGKEKSVDRLPSVSLAGGKRDLRLQTTVLQRPLKAFMMKWT